MKSNNPVFARSDDFSGRGAQTNSDPSQWQIDLNGQPTSPVSTERRMTIDSVVEKTAISLGLVFVAAAVTWFMIGDLAVDDAAVQRATFLAVGGGLIRFVLVMVNSFKKVVNPTLVMAYALVEGVFVGAISKMIASMVGEPSIVFQAVLATAVAFAGTLAAYKFFNIRVTDKFRKIMIIASFSILGVLLLNLVLSLTGVFDQGGLRGFNGLGLLFSVVMVVFAVFMLIMDFDEVERGVAAGLPERESWRGALGLTVTLVFMYIEILRILAIMSSND